MKRLPQTRLKCACAKCSLALAVALAAVPSVARPQLIPVRTVPLATGDQFGIFPAEREGMGGVSLALEDRLADPVRNPALASALTSPLLFSSPSYYTITRGGSHAVTLPVGAMFGTSTWFGGATIAIQELDPRGKSSRPIPVFQGDFAPVPTPLPDPTVILRDRVASNRYAFAMLGRHLGDGRTALAVSAAWGGLNALDGVTSLYPASQRIDQFGHMVDYRVGLVRDFGGDRMLDVTAVHHRLSMQHDVTYLTWVPIYGPPCGLEGDTVPCGTLPGDSVETNFDQDRAWGLNARYRQPLSSGWIVAGSLTGNLKTHPRIPNYELMNIPRDPGRTWAFQAGIGLARQVGVTQLGIDAVYQPIFSHTWAETSTLLINPAGQVIPAGGKTVDNHFQFSNTALRMGMGFTPEHTPAGVQLGLEVRSINYRMTQRDYRVLDAERTQHEGWLEWTPTWGLTLRLPNIDLRYFGRVTTGTGSPGAAWNGSAPVAEFAGAADYLVAPSGPLTLQGSAVVTHRLVVTMPIR